MIPLYRLSWMLLELFHGEQLLVLGIFCVCLVGDAHGAKGAPTNHMSTSTVLLS